MQRTFATLAMQAAAFLAPVAIGVGLAGSAGAAPACSRQSPAHSIALIELYTSEGCSSCPPADQFLRGLRASGISDTQAVALSLHVDYWDYIGWKDPYGRAAFTARQRALSDLAGSRTIYTPEFFVGGKELRNWHGAMPETLRRINATPARAQIGITLGAPGATGMGIAVKASAQQDAKLHIALVQSALASKVGRGENGGRTLVHDHVVREWLAPAELKAGVAATLTRTLALPARAPLANLGVVAFVQSARGEVLQALSLAPCGV